MEQIIFDSLARYGEADILNFFACYFEGNVVGAVNENTVAVVCHIEWYAFVSDLGCSTAVFIPGIDNLSVFHEWGESLAKAVYALTYAKGQLTYHVWLIFFGHVVRCRQHGALLAIPSDIGKVAESASGQDFSVCLEGVSKDTFSLYAYQYASGVENCLILVDGNGYVLVYALCFVEGRNFVVVCFIVPCFHGDGIRCMCYELNGDGRQVQGHTSVLDRAGGSQDTHTAWDLLYFISLHCMGCICFFTRKPVTFCEFHLFITS